MANTSRKQKAEKIIEDRLERLRDTSVDNMVPALLWAVTDELTYLRCEIESIRKALEKAGKFV